MAIEKQIRWLRKRSRALAVLWFLLTLGFVGFMKVDLVNAWVLTVLNAISSSLVVGYLLVVVPFTLFGVLNLATVDDVLPGEERRLQRAACYAISGGWVVLVLRMLFFSTLALSQVTIVAIYVLIALVPAAYLALVLAKSRRRDPA
ncbi:MAG: hypothetical protein JST35_04890 [Armatimonadetes bacterium]|nr:hypothetical protein [Armatimonadota bacterium]